MDVKPAFLNGTLDDDIFVVDTHKRLSEVALELGRENDINEPCLFTWRLQNQMVVLLLYVDDIILAGNNQMKLKEIKEKLFSAFQMNDVGEPKVLLDMKITRDRDQRILKLCLERFNMKNSKPQKTHMVTRQVQNRELKISEENQTTTQAPYREAIRSLLYLAGTARPDIAFAVNFLSRKQLSPTESDWK